MDDHRNRSREELSQRRAYLTNMQARLSSGEFDLPSNLIEADKQRCNDEIALIDKVAEDEMTDKSKRKGRSGPSRFGSGRTDAGVKRLPAKRKVRAKGSK